MLAEHVRKYLRMATMDSDGFTAALLKARPELRWPDAADDDGVYPSFGLGIIPALVELLPPLLDPPSDVRGDHRDEYQPLPTRGTGDAAGLVARVYQFIEHAAVAGDETVTEAIGVELGTGGYGGLTPAQLVSLAGPETCRLVLT